MLPESIQLETLRQSIEDAEFEVGDKTDYLSYGKPNPKQAQQTKELIENLKSQSKTLREEFKQRIATVRAQQPQALEEWVNFHTDILQKVMEETKMGAEAVARRNVAKETIQNWEKVRAGELDYVSINWHFLKDYKASVRTITGKNVKTTEGVAQSKSETKSKWQFWK